ncbi:hypothetical protein BC834DRAFT_320978 [Gloeopeniophorella convolvens]|nr:hypothetical protein BC834DRAFT_320978 [Gloeopeniophorella convolvens]
MTPVLQFVYQSGGGGAHLDTAALLALKTRCRFGAAKLPMTFPNDSPGSKVHGNIEPCSPR